MADPTTTKTSNSIKAIDKQTVHQICSGQVVLDLSTAVKELVENSIDAGANNIEIRLKEYGKELIEVSDNGLGIKEEDFDALALKHYTSKLREFNDLPSVNTFGFRGEALSSLSALGDLSVTTHHKSMEVGSKLTFNRDGKLVDRSFTARQQGTSVKLLNLFHTLPVRHKEFHRNYKKDFSKLMNVLNAFCLINGTVRINCVNQVGSKKNKLISTNGKNSVLDTISTIFGANQVKSLIKIEQNNVSDTVLEEYHISQDIFKKYGDMFLINGYISSVTHGCGRSVTDRQFFFINNRPCDFPKLARVVNEVYHSYNTHQYPFVFLNMILNKDYVDINVTPDKRQIMVQQENILLVIVKSTLRKMFEQNATVFTENKLSNRSVVEISVPFCNISPPTTQNLSVNNSLHDTSLEDAGKKLFSQFQSLEQNSSFDITHASPLDKYRIKNEDGLNDSSTSLDTSSLSPLDRFRSRFEKSFPVGCNSSFTKRQKTPEQLNLMSFFSPEPKKRKLDEDVDTDNIIVINYSKKLHVDYNNDCILKEKIDGFPKLVNDEKKIESLFGSNENDDSEVVNEKKVLDSELGIDENSNGSDIITVDVVDSNIKSRPSVEIDFDFNKIKENYTKYYISKAKSENNKKYTGSFFAKISASDNKNAEAELGKNVTKEMFSRMEILGQFNLGFIITKLENDLFIVDQHATDEKYNYETLQRTKCLKGQRLIQPLPMNLTFVNETVLVDNLEIFQKNGFEFEIEKNGDDEEEIKEIPIMENLEKTEKKTEGIKLKNLMDLQITNLPLQEVLSKVEHSSSEEKPDISELKYDPEIGKPEKVCGVLKNQIKLLTVPTSRNWSFSVDDVEELIYILGDSPGVFCRPSRVHKMFASRACRKSIMIGTALNKQQMKRVVCHMGEIDHPWNCPHGRPTMRHLVNLDRIEY